MSLRTLRARSALTLVELLVVLAVLVILAGIVLPKLDGVLSKAHSGQGAAAIGDVARAMETYRTLNGRYPTQFDSMMQSNTARYAGLLPGAHAKYLVANITQVEVDSLNLAGVTRVVRNIDAPDTLPSDTGNLPAVAIETSTGLLRLDVTNAEVQGVLLREFRQDPLDVLGAAGDGSNARRTYLVFGIGTQCTICNGKAGVMRDAPLHQDTDPGRFYNRFVVIFATSKIAGDKADFIGAVGPDGDTMATHMNEFFKSEEGL